MENKRNCWCGADKLERFGPDYRRCIECGTLVSQVGITDDQTLVRDDSADFYGRKYWLEHMSRDLGYPDVYDRSRLDLSERCVDWLRALLRFRPPPATALELGAAHGAYTALLRYAGYDATALDLSTWVADFARETFQIPYLVGPVEQQNIAAASLEVIAANDVLEHLPQPEGTLLHCMDLLTSGGVLAIQTPELPEGSRFEDLVAENNLFLEHMRKADEHLYLFTRSSLEMLLHRVGATEVAFEPSVYSYDMFCMASAQPLRRAEFDLTAIRDKSQVGPLVLALLDAHEAWRVSEKDRAARLDVIQRLDAELADAKANCHVGRVQ